MQTMVQTKCYCGKPATHHVKIKGLDGYKFADHPRCERHMKIAQRSWSNVKITPIK